MNKNELFAMLNNNLNNSFERQINLSFDNYFTNSLISENNEELNRLINGINKTYKNYVIASEAIKKSFE